MCRLIRFSDMRYDREGVTDYEGKIEGRGTRRGVRLGLHVGWRGTRLEDGGASVVAKSLMRSAFGRASPDGLRWGWRRGAV